MKVTISREGGNLLVTVEIIVPPMLKSQLKYIIPQWSLSYSNLSVCSDQNQIFSSVGIYVELNQIVINGYEYEKIIFDFEKGSVCIVLFEYCEQATNNLLELLTIYTDTGMVFLSTGRKTKK